MIDEMEVKPKAKKPSSTATLARWAKNKKSPAWLVAAIMQGKGLTLEAQISELEYDQIVDQIKGVKL